MNKFLFGALALTFGLVGCSAATDVNPGEEGDDVEATSDEAALRTMVQAGTYSAVLSYLKAVQAAGSDASDAVAAKLRETPVNDAFARNATVAPNGRLLNDVFLMQVKTPAESTGEWDYYKIITTIPGAEAYMNPAESGCPLVTG